MGSSTICRNLTRDQLCWDNLRWRCCRFRGVCVHVFVCFCIILMRTWLDPMWHDVTTCFEWKSLELCLHCLGSGCTADQCRVAQSRALCEDFPFRPRHRWFGAQLEEQNRAASVSTSEEWSEESEGPHWQQNIQYVSICSKDVGIYRQYGPHSCTHTCTHAQRSMHCSLTHTSINIEK